MGKRQHQKDKMYLTFTEWTTLYGGKKCTIDQKMILNRLRFDLCCLTFQPFRHPYCDTDGNIFELEAILKYLKKYKINPITGKLLASNSLVKLNFSRNDGQLQCPILRKIFTLNSHIIALKTTGNVFSYEAVERLNIKTTNWKDLMNDTPFQRSDIITLQDPHNLGKFNINSFYHVRTQKSVEMNKEGTFSMSVNKETADILRTLKKEYEPVKKEIVVVPVADKINAAHYSTGTVAAGFTSTVMSPETVHQPAIIAEDELRYERVTRKGYIRLNTNLGPLNIELYCHLVPKTCENFIKLCQNDYYNNKLFHRSIRHFMIQAGDPKGPETGGKSFWGKNFHNEIKIQLNHTGRGVISMVNSEQPNTNNSQFFITYRSCRHLDGKHTVFGQIVGGFETLNNMEKIEVDNKDRPIENIIIESSQIFVNPYEEADEKMLKDREVALIEKLNDEKKISLVFPFKVYRDGVGKYLDLKRIKEETSMISDVPKNKIKIKNYNFNDFSSW